jgi:hypothetical protein
MFFLEELYSSVDSVQILLTNPFRGVETFFKELVVANLWPAS